MTATLSTEVYPADGTVLACALFDAAGLPCNLVDFNVNTIQTVEVRAGGGTFTLSFGGHTTGPLAIGADPNTGTGNVQTAFTGLASVGSGNATVTGFGYPYKITFTGTLTGLPQALITVATTSLTATGSAPATTAGTSTPPIADATPSATFVTIGSWIPGAAPFGAAVVVNAGGLGLNAAQWLVSGLAAGNYAFYLSNSQSSGSTVSQSTPVRVFDGTTPRIHAVIDESAISGAGTVSLPGSSASFLLIGTGYITASTTCRVMVTDEVLAGDVGKLVVCNQLAIVPIDPTAPVFYDNLSNYCNLTGSWSTFGAGWNGREHFNNAPADLAEWEFAGLISNGSYKFEAQWTPGGNRPSAVLYTVYDSDGTTSLGTATLDQTAAPSGGTNHTDNNAVSTPFSVIGTFTVTGNKAYIRVHPTSAGSNVTMAEACACTLVSTGGYKETVAAPVATFSSGNPTVTVNGGSPVVLTKFIWEKAQTQPSPLITFYLPTPVITTDVLLFSSGANCFTGHGGVVLPAITNQAVTNHVGHVAGTAMPGTITMGVGWNLRALGYSQQLYSNAVKNCVGMDYVGSDPTVPIRTADLYPQYLHQNPWSLTFGSMAVNPTDALGYPAWPSGTTWIEWDGPTAFYPRPVPSAGTSLAFVSVVSGQATNNLMKVTITNDPAVTRAPIWSLTLHGVYDLADESDTGRTSSVGTWTPVTNTAAFNGGYQHNDSLLASTFTWNLHILPGGTYAVNLTWIANAGASTAATVVVKEGSTTLVTYNIDQTASPSAAATHDVNWSVVNFDNTGNTFTCLGVGAVTVTLSAPTGKLAIADAVQVSLIGDLTSGSPYLPMSNLRVYPPFAGLNQASPTKFNPQVLALLAGAKSLRSMQIMDSNAGGMIDFADYPATTQLCYGLTGQTNRYNITQVETYANADGFFEPNKGWALITVTAIDGAPLPILTGVPFSFPAPLTIPNSAGGAVVLDGFTGIVYHDTGTMASGQFAVAAPTSGPRAAPPHTDWPASQTLTTTNPVGSVGQKVYAGIPPADYFELCATVGCPAYLNLTPIVTQACINSMAAAYMAAITTGSKCYLEFANEPWNTAYGFPFSQLFYGLSAIHSPPLGDPQQAYAMVASQRHDWFRTALGGRSGELIEVFNCQASNVGTADSVFTYCGANGKTVGMIVTAPYVSNYPANETDTEIAALYPGLNAAQLVDQTQAWWDLGNFFKPILANYQNRSIAHGVPIGCYEGGLSSLAIGGTISDQELQAISGRHHPAVVNLINDYLATLQLYGFSLFNNYDFDSPAIADFSSIPDSTYGVYIGTSAIPGKGDGSDSLHDNRTEIGSTGPLGPINFLTAVSPIGLAFNTWNTPAGPVIGPLAGDLIVDESMGSALVGSFSGLSESRCWLGFVKYDAATSSSFNWGFNSGTSAALTLGQTYEVYASWDAETTYCNVVNFSVLGANGTTVLGTAVKDQTINLAHGDIVCNDGSHNIQFYFLCTIVADGVQGGVTSVNNGTNGSGNFMLADAILYRPIGAPVATAFSLTPPAPAQGQPGVVSGLFTVQFNGVPASTTTVTIATTSGTLSTTTLVISDALPHTFTIDPTAVGPATISVTNSGAFSNPASVTYTAFALTLLPSSQTTLTATATFLTATLAGGTGVLAAITSDPTSTLSTAAPVSATPFTVTTPPTGSGTFTVTVTGPGGTTASATVTYAPPTTGGGPVRKWLASRFLRRRR